MRHDEDVQFIHRISAIESSLLAFQPSRVDDFYQQYTEYTSALEVAIRANVLKPSTTALAIALSVKVYHTIESSLEVESLSQKLMGSFLDETAAILDCSTKDTLLPPSHISEPTLAPYIKPSYEWLVANIHNPYPSPDIRNIIARRSGAARKDVDSWFMDARKRIGWNEARKTHFSNKRADIIDAATRFYGNDEKLSLSQGAEHAFISIMKNAKDLYCDKFNQTTLASKLDAAVKDLTPQTKADAKAERLRQSQMKKARDPYPSPERSPEPEHHSSAPCDHDIDKAPTQSISITSRKRQNVPVELVDAEQVEDTRPVKRARLDESSSLSINTVPLPTGLPSPVSSIDEPLQDAEPSETSSSSQPVPSVPSHKRRSSESDTQFVPKRPRNLPQDPRIQVVSDPSSMSSALFNPYSTPFDGWFEQNFDLPNVFDSDCKDLTGFDFELGTLSDIDCADVQTGEVHVLDLPAPEVPPDVHLTTSTTDFSNGELKFLWSSASSSINSEQVPITLRDICVPSLPSFDFDLINHTGEVYSPASVMDSTMKPSLSPTYFSWSFPDMPISLTCDHTFDITAGIPLSAPAGCSESPTATIPPSYHGDCRTRSLEQATVRAEKMIQLLKMKEDALQLELELATT